MAGSDLSPGCVQCDKPLRPLSEVLIDFASPFFPLASRNGPAASFQPIIHLAGIVWDCVVQGASARDIIEAFDDDEQSATRTAMIVEALVKRKKMFFAADERIVTPGAITPAMGAGVGAA